MISFIEWKFNYYIKCINWVGQYFFWYVDMGFDEWVIFQKFFLIYICNVFCKLKIVIMIYYRKLQFGFMLCEENEI